MAHTFTPSSLGPRAGRFNLDTIAAIEARVELAACLQLAALHGLEEGICNHFSATVPGHDGLFFVNPFGYAFEEITASHLLVCDFAGNVIDGDGTPEATAFYIHAQLHQQPRIKAAFHTHMPNTTALCLLQGPPLLWLGQTALKFYGRTAVDEHYNGLALDNREGQRIAAELGDADVLFLKNHGVMVTAPNIAEAWDDLYYLERAAQVQLKAMACGEVLKPIDPQVAKLASSQMREGDPASARAHLDSAMRRLKLRGSHFDR